MNTLLANQQIKRHNTVSSRFFIKIIRFFLLLIGLSFFVSAISENIKSYAFKREISFQEDTMINTLLSDYLFMKTEDEGSVDIIYADKIECLTLSDYTIKSGDTLSGISEKTGLKMDTIISFNNIKDARRLIPEMVLKIPNEDGLIYNVKSGDTLEQIAYKFNTSLNAILDWNSLESDIIHPNQQLFIAGARLSEYELNSVLGTLFIWPTEGTLTSKYGIRISPFTGYEEFHHGIDIANNLGTPIIASLSGTVEKTGNDYGLGNFIILSHGNGIQTLYAHLSKILVTKGMYIAQGQKIGEMGNTGLSTGSHLHFSIYKNNKDVDPLKYLSQ